MSDDKKNFRKSKENLPTKAGDDSSKNIMPTELGKILEKLPPEDRQQVSAIMQFSSFKGPSGALLFEKFNDGHVTKFLDQIEKHDEREFKFSLDSKKKNFILIMVSIVGILGLIIFFTLKLSTNNPTLYKDLMNLLIGAGLGFAGGFGFGRSQKNKE
jgi:hypothetical protein